MVSRTVFLLPEDSAKEAYDILRRLVAHALDATGLGSTEVVFERAPPPVAAFAVQRRWAAKRRDCVSFVQWIATRLMQCDVVVIHLDADVPWSRRDNCINQEQFDKNVRRSVNHQIAATSLVAMVPFTMIEAWTYRHTRRALILSRNHAFHVASAADPERLEEQPHVKAASPLEDRYNLDLVSRGWPAIDAWADERSFRAFCDALVRTGAFGERPGSAGTAGMEPPTVLDPRDPSRA